MCFLIGWSWVQGGPPPEALGGSNVGGPQRRQEPEPPQARRAPHQSEGGACGEMADEGCQVIAAIYARKSTADERSKEEGKSVERQIENATEYAAEHGWTVDPDLIFVDENISGGEFANRPGLAACRA